jgi:hypothetical protein
MWVRRSEDSVGRPLVADGKNCTHKLCESWGSSGIILGVSGEGTDGVPGVVTDMAQSEAEKHDVAHSAPAHSAGAHDSVARRHSTDAGASPESGVRLSEIKEAILDDAQLRTLFADIATYGKVQEVTMKASPRSRPENVRRLPELYLKLVERRLYGAQIRYEFESAAWLDTLVTTPAGCRLVRVRLPD